MATTDTIKNQIKSQQTESKAPAKQQPNSVKTLLNSPAIQNKFKEILDDKTSTFTSSLITLISNDDYLADSQPMSIISGAMQAAQLDLPLEKQFGFAYLVPFNQKEGNSWVKKAQFVLGYKGYIQLAQRSGQYRNINVGNVYEGQLKSWNPFTEELLFEPEGQTSDKVIGYFGYFKLINGFEKTVYWTKEEIEKHRIANNKGKSKNDLSGVWRTDYDAMAQKTVLRNLLSKWGILSVQMQKAVVSDDQIAEEVADDGEVIFKDVTPEDVPQETEDVAFLEE
ncbi:recombinase RecT [Aerococcaceae bacterium DSM 111020]|nr:recombinase RecT [Aerococcaceae bacterium DSM 111020]